MRLLHGIRALLSAKSVSRARSAEIVAAGGRRVPGWSRLHDLTAEP